VLIYRLFCRFGCRVRWSKTSYC